MRKGLHQRKIKQNRAIFVFLGRGYNTSNLLTALYSTLNEAQFLRCFGVAR